MKKVLALGMLVLGASSLGAASNHFNVWDAVSVNRDNVGEAATVLNLAAGAMHVHGHKYSVESFATAFASLAVQHGLDYALHHYGIAGHLSDELYVILELAVASGSVLGTQMVVSRLLGSGK